MFDTWRCWGLQTWNFLYPFKIPIQIFTANYRVKCWWRHYQSQGADPRCVCVGVFFFSLIQLHFFRISLTEGKQMDAAEVCGENMTNVTGRRRFKPGKCPDRNGDIMYGSPLWVYASLCGLRAVTTWVKRGRCSNKLAASLAVVARSVVASAAFRDCRKYDEVVVFSEMKTRCERHWSCDDSTDDRWASTLAKKPGWHINVQKSRK